MVKNKFLKKIWAFNAEIIKFNKRRSNMETFNIESVFLIVIGNIKNAKLKNKMIHMKFVSRVCIKMTEVEYVKWAQVFFKQFKATVVSNIKGFKDKNKFIKIVDIIIFVDIGFRKFTFIDLSHFSLTLRSATNMNSVKSSTSDRSTSTPATSIKSSKSTSKKSSQSYQAWLHLQQQH